MPKDYAKYPFKDNRSIAEQGWTKRLFIVVILLLLIGGSLYGLYLYKTHSLNQEMITGWISNVKKFIKHTDSVNPPVQTKATQEMSAEPEVHFDFYTELPQKQIILPKPQKQAETIAPPPSPEKEKIILQLGLYQNKSEASEQRVFILLSGYDADIVEVIENAQTFYRIQQGPFKTLGDAKVMQKRLQSKGIDGEIKKE